MPVHRFEYRVIFGDTDALGIVYYANYLRIFEAARNEFFRDRIRLPLDMIRDDLHPIVVKAFLHFYTPARFDDVLVVETWIPAARANKASFQFDHNILKKGTDEKILSGFTVHALTSKEGRLRRMPGDFYDIIRRVAADRDPMDG